MPSSSPLTNCDPRLRPDFDPVFLPKCEGWGLPSKTTENRYEQLILEFTGAYYELNRVQALVEEARRESDETALREALRQMQAASQSRDALEDRCAPEGFYADPVMEGNRYANLLFHWANKVDQPSVFTQQFTAEFTF